MSSSSGAPYTAALPWALVRLGSAPATPKNLASSVCPLVMAMCSGVLPYLLREFGLAPLASRFSAAQRLPEAAARCSRVRPFESCASTSSFRFWQISAAAEA